ncbi:MAG: ribulose-phosphate 3-epimerase [Firmicutes bacterium]|nr:ribulose-phosphate 3-epimerase [Bacillota bacterium]
MKKLAPSILSADFSKLAEEVREVEEAGAHLVHFDVMDGQFVPNITIGPLVAKSLTGKTAMPLDVHLMIVDPDRYIPEFVTPQTEYVSVHAEACVHLHRTIQMIRSLGVKAGVALNPATPLSVLEYVLEDLDMVLIMSVNPGFGNQKFIPQTLQKVRELDAIRSRRNLDFEIEIDGGVGPGNIQEIARAGADILVAGSAVFGAEDRHGRVQDLIRLMNE